MKINFKTSLILMAMLMTHLQGTAQADSSRKQHKNVIRYNLSGAMLFGADKYIVLGYERVLFKNQSMSLNAGLATLPKLITLSTNLFYLDKDKTNTGYNVSLDYRFYIRKENKFKAPRGVYIGPYASYNKFRRDTRWEFTNKAKGSTIDTRTDFSILCGGFEAGYQFILWNRLSIDMVMVGPGFGVYSYEAKLEGNLQLNTDERSDLYYGLQQLLMQRYPGANFIFAEKKINADGVMRTAGLGYRYLIHVGFNF